ncbi:MAG: hypothetical protein N4A38_00355 [Candidatus Gracilibacteria bacterium]|nr:hypothetical protein [Candidatus Gracilibacteria bacterium]
MKIQKNLTLIILLFLISCGQNVNQDDFLDNKENTSNNQVNIINTKEEKIEKTTVNVNDFLGVDKIKNTSEDNIDSDNKENNSQENQENIEVLVEENNNNNNNKQEESNENIEDIEINFDELFASETEKTSEITSLENTTEEDIAALVDTLFD